MLAADRFAVEIFRRNGMAPTGIPLYLLEMAHWFQNRNGWSNETHPVFTDRLFAIAKDIMESTEDFASSESDINASVKTVVGITNALCHVADTLNQSNLKKPFGAIEKTNVAWLFQIT